MFVDIYILCAGPTVIYGEKDLIKNPNVDGSSVSTVRKAEIVSENELPLPITWRGRKECARRHKPIFR